ncbi:hypothetical protein [Anaerospora hongkongensis]|uniref:hypothetical protein n=1 Tax=Anaerospora hongkongensis TaxID=244830 RepID=UPI00289D6BB6|nr:hypothetical protein [Anaerospora hongkongensis]
MESALWGFIGTLVGAIISYFGNKAGAIKSHELQVEREKRVAASSLLRLINFTYEAVKAKKEILNSVTEIEFRVIFDREWPKYISTSGIFSKKEITIIILWFNLMEYLEATISENNGKIHIFAFNILVDAHIQDIESILEKYSEEYL